MDKLSDIDIIAILHPDTPISDWETLPVSEIEEYRQKLALSEQEKIAAFLAVETTRPIDLSEFLMGDETAIDKFIATNGTNAAIFAIVRVLRYLVACKDRAKYQT